MSLYQFRLKAGVPFQAPISGKMILVDSTGEAESIDITPMRGGQEDRPLTRRQKAFKCWVDYDAIVLTAAVDCTVHLFLSRTDVSLGFADGANVNVRGGVSIENDPNNPVPVSLEAGTVTVTADNVGINNTEANPVPTKVTTTDAAPVVVRKAARSTLSHPAAVAVGLAATAIVSDATLKKIVIRNGHASANVAIGGAGVTLANGAIQLAPGDIWIEEDAAGAAWFAISDTAGANVQVMGYKP